MRRCFLILVCPLSHLMFHSFYIINSNFWCHKAEMHTVSYIIPGTLLPSEIKSHVVCALCHLVMDRFMCLFSS